MEVEEPLEKEHEQKAGEQPEHGHVDGPQLGEAVRQEVQQADAQNDARHEADRDLHPLVGQLDDERNPAAGERAPTQMMNTARRQGHQDPARSPDRQGSFASGDIQELH